MRNEIGYELIAETVSVALSGLQTRLLRKNEVIHEKQHGVFNHGSNKKPNTPCALWSLVTHRLLHDQGAGSQPLCCMKLFLQRARAAAAGGAASPECVRARARALC